jgi:hypothetical protein
MEMGILILQLVLQSIEMEEVHFVVQFIFFYQLEAEV